MSNGFAPTPNGMGSQILNLAGLLSRGRTLRVPRYQRPYTWTEREVRRLIQDLFSAHNRNAGFYFIGQIVLVDSEDGGSEISDGQQRMVTLTMILAYARDRLRERREHYQSLIADPATGEPRLVLRAESASFFRGYVQEAGRMRELALEPENGVDAHDLMCSAARSIAQQLGDLSDEDLDDFLSFICNQTTFNVVDTAERGYAGVIYYTLNDPGLALSAADNIKCELLESSGLSEAESNDAARNWEAQEEQLGRANFAKLLNMMPFLLTGEQMVSPRDLSSFRERVEQAGGVRNFLFEKLPRYSEALLDIFNASVDVGPDSADVNRRLSMMKLLDEWHWAPAVLAFLAEHRAEHDRAQRFFLALERYAFACELAVVESDERMKRFHAAARLVGDDDQLYTDKVLDLSDRERFKFIERVNRSTPRDKQRRLLLMRLEAAMPGGAILALNDDVTAEHVLPKKGGPWWNSRFPDPGLRSDAAHLLGNMVLITDRQNKRAEVKGFPEKRRIYFETEGAPLRALTKDIEDVEDWTLDTIDRRQERLVRILCADWDLVRMGR